MRDLPTQCGAMIRGCLAVSRLNYQLTFKASSGSQGDIGEGMSVSNCALVQSWDRYGVNMSNLFIVVVRSPVLVSSSS
jgi:hypothetical protein